ncbi:kinase-like domain-containing protein [Lophiotrema nucula]|uniref:Kinase-like domain-containing protein n=1 Tax=Lophiotrema nucula TaxID=690887 RepID=A0A6A5YE18_9PLEO|nr:kinase-like domain-containing protein [Lophiotrema nucula]
MERYVSTTRVAQGPYGDDNVLIATSQPGTPDYSSAQLTIRQGDDLELDSKDGLPYVVLSVLGHGGSAYVEKVRDVNTGSVFARKTYRNVYARTLQEAKERFRNELRILHRLHHHHHIIQLFATYVAQRELAIILHPVADSGDLTAYMQDYTENYHERATSDIGRRIRRATLWKAFGCLASTLAFIHEQAVRHKDIKPGNILIHEGTILYTDFGISFDFQDQGSTTTGHPGTRTKRYCAPEVAYWNNRNSKSDIFSLGCVFIEILAVLEPNLLPDSLLQGPFFETFDRLPVSEEISSRSLEEPYDDMLRLIRNMTDPDSQRRLSAAQIILRLGNSRLAVKWFCDKCLRDSTSHQCHAPAPARQRSWKLDYTRAMWSIVFIITSCLIFFRLIEFGPAASQVPTKDTIPSSDTNPNQVSAPPFSLEALFVITNPFLDPSLALSSSASNDSVFIDTLSYTSNQKWYFTRTDTPDAFRLHTVQKGDFASLDVFNYIGRQDINLHFYSTGNYPGQFWTLEKTHQGNVKFTNHFTGPDVYLGVEKDSLDVRLSNGVLLLHHWMLTPVDRSVKGTAE